MARKEISTLWNRENRNNVNDNFKELYNVQDRAIQEATEAVIKDSKLIWQEPVATFDDIDTTYPNAETGYTVMTRDNGKVYRFSDGSWNEIQDIDPTAINNVETRINDKIGNLDDLDTQNKTSLVEATNEVTSQLEETPIQANTFKYRQKRSAVYNPVIVAYGDSNTRYYEGDSSSAGSVSHAYSAWIDRFCVDYPNFYGCEIINAGHPGEDISYGLNNYQSNITDNNANIAIIGFGTNDIKRESAELEVYLSDMGQMIDNLLIDDVVPIILGIPWYDENYAPGTETRLPIWNEALMELCVKKNVEFVDVYKMFTSDFADLWFNEVSTPKRHYSIYAQKVLAEKIFKRILHLNNLASNVGDFAQTMFDRKNTEWVDGIESANFDDYSLGLDSINTLVIPNGESITVNLSGRFVLAFYPRASATASFDDQDLGDVIITNEIDGGLYYPIKRVGLNNNSRTGSRITLTITAVGGDLYIRGIYGEQKPRVYNKEKAYFVHYVDADNLQSYENIGDPVFVNELQKEIIYRGGYWYDFTGYWAVGNTTDRASLEQYVPKGFKFYNTETEQRERWDGESAWTTW